MSTNIVADQFHALLPWPQPLTEWGGLGECTLAGIVTCATTTRDLQAAMDGFFLAWSAQFMVFFAHKYAGKVKLA